MLTDEPYYKYAIDVLSGEIVACRHIVSACRRFLADLEREDLVFSPSEVAHAINFIGTLRHFTGKSDGKPFVLEPWQSFIVANIIGFRWKEGGSRRFTSSYIECARKQGKTALSSALCLYFLVADGEGGAEVLLCANSKDQAKIAFDMCRNYAKGIDPSEKLLRGFRADIFLDETQSRLRVLAADDSKLDGFNASFGLIDEYHAAKNSRVRDVIKSSMGMRQNPHLCTITTAGFDKSLPCYGLRTVAIEVLDGVKHDDEMFVVIYSLDDEDDWTDEAVWPKSNPNLGVTVTAKYIRGQVQQAKNNPSDEVGVKTKTLNVWCDSSQSWIPDTYVNAATRDIDWSRFAGMPCYVGVDLGSTSDLTVMAWMIPDDDGVCWFGAHYYLPEAALHEKTDHIMYQYWRNSGMLTVTPGNVTDYDYITKDLLTLSDNLNIISVGYDKWNAVQWAIDATERGLPLMEFSQAIGNFNRPTREFERLLMSGRAMLDNNEITRFCFRNVVLKSDHNGNVKPDKGLERKKIDGVIAMIQALGVWLDAPRYTNEIFII